MKGGVMVTIIPKRTRYIMLCLCEDPKIILGTSLKIRKNRLRWSTHLCLWSIVSNVGIGHCSLLHNSNRVILGPPFVMPIDVITVSLDKKKGVGLVNERTGILILDIEM